MFSRKRSIFWILPFIVFISRDPFMDSSLIGKLEWPLVEALIGASLKPPGLAIHTWHKPVVEKECTFKEF